MLRFALLATLAFCLTEAAPSGYGYGYAAPHNGHEASVNRNNAARQLGVNGIANHIGSGSGTASYDGVPGTVLGVTGHDRYSYGNGHGNGYGHGGYGNNNFGGYGYNNGGYGGFGGYSNHHGFSHGHGFGGYGAN